MTPDTLLGELTYFLCSRSDFGQKFAEAATKIPGVEMEYTSFDSAIVSVPRHDLDAFQEFVRTGVVTVVSRR
jgi:hypothetical protein